jgi:fused signal recognition particle receptor
VEYVVIGVVVVLVLGVVLAAYLIPRRPRTGPPPGPRPDLLGRHDNTAAPLDTVPSDLDTVTPPDDTLVEGAERLPAPPERPEPAAGRLVRLRSRLARSQSALGKGLLGLLTRERLDEDTWQEIEDTLLTADLGVAPSRELVERLQTRVRVEGVADPAAARALLRDELVALVDPTLDRSLRTDRHADRPAVVLVVGVNGTGKTTTVGKLARVLVAEDREQEADVVIIDTAGRLQTKVGLMEELGKVKRVVEKQGPVDEVLLVLDATTGQNGLAQARVFSEVVDVTGIVLTKLDGTAKGGIVVAVQRELGVPVKLVGLGEGADDLAPFDPEAFVDGLLG